MILAGKLIFSFVVTLIVTAAFYRSYKLEEEKGVPINLNGRIYIWTSPLIFPLLFVLYPLMFCVVFRGRGYGLSLMIKLSINAFLFMSIYFAVLLLLLPVLRKYFRARTCAVLWILPVFVWYGETLYPNFYRALPWIRIPFPFQLERILGLIWLCGVVGVFGYQIISHFLFRRELLLHAEPVTDPEILRLWEKENQEINLKLPVSLNYCDQIDTPLSMGIFKKKLITMIPPQEYTPEELRLLFQHELHHLQRADVETKIFLGFCKAFSWFNPLTWIAVKKASEDLELSCDEVVLQDKSEAERREYAELLLKTAGQGRGYTTCLSANASTLRYRLRKVMQPVKQRKGCLLLACMIFLCCITVGMAVFVGEKTTVDKAVSGMEQMSDIADLSICTSDNIKNIDIENINAKNGNIENRNIENGNTENGNTENVNTENGNTENVNTDNGNTEKRNEKLETWLQNLQCVQLKKMYTPYTYEPSGKYMNIMLQDGRLIVITETFMCITQYRKEYSRTNWVENRDYYLVDSVVPWAIE